MKNPFKKADNRIGFSIHAEGMNEKKMASLFPWLLKILNTSAGDAVKIAAIEVIGNASKSEISNVAITNAQVTQGGEK